MTYKRIMLKLSGEAFSKQGEQGIDPAVLHDLAARIVDVAKTGVQLAIVVGGGNIWRYRDNQKSDIKRTTSDFMGMLATVMNGAALQEAIESFGVEARVLSSIPVPQLVQAYSVREALHHLEKGSIVICAGGTGNPFFTTDTAAALRACELSCDVVLKATTVDGVYDKDPKKHPDAKKYETLTYKEALDQHLNVMDQTAFSLCQEQKVPIVVFDFEQRENLLKAIRGEKVGTIVKD